MTAIAPQCAAEEVDMELDGLDGLEILEPHECLTLLARCKVGRVGLVVSGAPRVLPVNYASDGDGNVIFRTADTSILTTVATRPVAFEVDGFDERYQTGWSVCVQGVGREITGADDPMAQRLQQLNVITWAPGQRDRWFAITADEITGRRIPLAVAPSDFGWIPGVLS
jgi:nitroimidazol reductase NimA-like FMN-containing flavoprotein (pyridoxamine 5'-phosphate oxidase superfamily)